MCGAGRRPPQGWNCDPKVGGHPAKQQLNVTTTNNVHDDDNHTYSEKKPQKTDYLAGRKTKDEEQQCERVARVSPEALVSSCSIIKRLIAQSKIVKQYCMVVLHDMT